MEKKGTIDKKDKRKWGIIVSCILFLVFLFLFMARKEDKQEVRFVFEPTMWANEDVKVTASIDEESLKNDLTLKLTTDPMSDPKTWIEASKGIKQKTNGAIYAFLVDEDGNAVKACGVANVKNIDKNPVIVTSEDQNMEVEFKENSIDVTVRAEDQATDEYGKSGIRGYYFSKDGENYSDMQTKPIYTFSELLPGTTYLIRIKILDYAGNITEIEKSITLPIVENEIVEQEETVATQGHENVKYQNGKKVTILNQPAQTNSNHDITLENPSITPVSPTENAKKEDVSEQDVPKENTVSNTTINTTVPDVPQEEPKPSVKPNPEEPEEVNGQIIFSYQPKEWTNQEVKVTANLQNSEDFKEDEYTLKLTLDKMAEPSTWQLASEGIMVTENREVYACLIKNEDQTVALEAKGKVTNIDKTLPKIVQAVVTNKNSIQITATDEASGIAGYQVTESNEQPARESFTECDTTMKLEVEVADKTPGKTYYVWVKDVAGNISSYKEVKLENEEEPSRVEVNFTCEPLTWTNGTVKVTAELGDATTDNMKMYILKLTMDKNSDPATWKLAGEGISVIENGEVYAYLVDENNKIKSTCFTEKITNIDKVGPELIDVNILDNRFEFSAKDEASGLAGYAITMDENVPKEFIEIADAPKTITQLVEDISDEREYYIWLKDVAGNITNGAKVDAKSPGDETEIDLKVAYTVWDHEKATVTFTTTTDYQIQVSTTEDSNEENWLTQNAMTVESGTTIYARLWDGEKVVCSYLSTTPILKYFIHYNSNGSDGVETMENTTHYYGTESPLSKNNYTKTGYTFRGWATSSNGEVVYTDEQSVLNMSKTNGETVELYAVWEANTDTKYRLEHYKMDVEGNYPDTPTETEEVMGISDSILMIADLQKMYDPFVYQYGQVNGETVTQISIAPDGSRVIKLYYERKKYTINYDANGGNVEPPFMTEYYEAMITMPIPTKENYRFKGWYTEALGGVLVSYAIMPNVDLTVYARWEEKEISIFADQITPTNYGEPVKYSANGINDWKVFYDDEEYVYLITSGYLPTSKMPKYTDRKMYGGGTYGTYWTSWSGNSITKESFKTDWSKYRNRFLMETWTLNDSNNGQIACAELMSPSSWSVFTNGTSGEYAIDSVAAIGSPTLEMWIKSWNSKGYLKLYYNRGRYGYYCGTSSNPKEDDIYDVKLNKTEGCKDKLYFPYTEDIDHCYAYRLAAPSGLYTSYLFTVYRDGGFGSSAITHDSSGDEYNLKKSTGIRPVVMLPKEIIGSWNGTIWELQPNYYKVEYYQMDENGNYADTPVEYDTFGIGEGRHLKLADLAKKYEHYSYHHAQVNGNVETDIEIAKGEINVVIKLYYERNKYSITYDLNDGTGDKEIETANFGTSITMPNPTREDYTFIGWYTKLSGGERVNYTTMPMQNITVYARWREKSKAFAKVIVPSNYGEEVNYNANGVNDWKIFYNDGTNVYLIKSNYLEHDKVPTASTGMTVSKYYTSDRYAYWSSVPEYQTAWTTGRGFMTSGYDLEAHKNYDNTKCVSTLLNTNNWTSFASGKSLNKNIVGCLAIGSPTLEMWTSSYKSKGYNIYDWGTAACGYFFQNGDTHVNPSYYGGSAYLKEKDSLYLPETSQRYGCSGYWLAGPAQNYNNRNYLWSIIYSTNTAFYTGHVTSIKNSVQSLALRPVVQLPADVMGSWNGEKWDLHQTYYKIEHYQMDLNGNYLSVATDTEELRGIADARIKVDSLVKNYTGFSYDYAQEGEDKVVDVVVDPDGTTLIKIYYKRNQYTLTFDFCDESGSKSSVTLKYGATVTLPSIEEKIGHTSGWYTAKSGGTQRDYTTMPAYDEILYAQWIPNQYYIDLNWTVDGVNNSSFSGDAYAGLKIGGVDKGYCKDYYQKHDYGTTWEIYGLKLNGTNIPYSKSGTIGVGNVDARVAINTINFTTNSANYGTVSSSSLYVLPETKYNASGNKITLSDGRSVTANVKTTTGYTNTFSNWSSTNGTINNAMTVQANFAQKVNSYTLTFNSNGGSACSAITKNYGTAITLPTPTRSGYTFSGWYTAASGGTKRTYTTMPAGNETLYAQWLANEKIIYNSGTCNYPYTVNFSSYVMFEKTQIYFQNRANKTLFFTSAFPNSYKYLKVIAKSTRNTSLGSYNISRFFVASSTSLLGYGAPANTIKDYYIASGSSSADVTSWTTFTLDLTNVTNSSYYVGLHNCDSNFYIQKIWLTNIP